MRIAMIAYTLYASDPRVKRAAEALAERGHQVDVFTISHDGTRKSGDCGPLRLRTPRVAPTQVARGTTVGLTRRSRRRSTSIASRSPAQRLASAASASWDSANDRNVASVSSRPCQ